MPQKTNTGMSPLVEKLKKETRGKIIIKQKLGTIRLEKETATHSSVLAWRIPGTVEPGGLPSMGSHRVGQD